MQQAIILVFQILSLFLMSQQLEKVVSGFFLQISRSQKIAMWLMSILFLPGVLIHELSHLIVGRLLLVRTGKMTLVPKLEPNGVMTMGNVHVPSTDRLRFFLIGVAPIYVGIGLILATMWLAEHFQLWGDWFWMGVIGFVVFQVANNMFLSASDLSGALWLFIVIAIAAAILYWIGWRPTFDWVIPWIEQHQAILNQVSRWLWVPVIIDAIVLMVIWLIPSAISRSR